MSGILQPLEWASYDLLYRLHPEETKDTRIVLVTWDEKDIQLTKNAIISDRDLSIVLERIIRQKPRVIGLDLYRDIPENSSLLSDEEDEKAHQRLSKILHTTDNLIAIEKVRPPTIDPPPVITESRRIASSDIIVDEDKIIRRSFFDPQPPIIKNGKTTYRSAPYLGLVLAYEYLTAEGWEIKQLDNQNYSLQFSKENRSFVISQLKPQKGSVLASEPGLDFLIYWRKNDNPFDEVSISKLINEDISPNVFKDKIVIIGNTAISTTDKHYTSLDRWFVSKKNNSWTYGLYIQAHVASSIISSALDKREQLKIISIDYLLLILFSIIANMTMYKYKYLYDKYLYLFCVLTLIIYCFILYAISQIAFLFGWWIPIVPGCLGALFALIITVNDIQIEKRKRIEYKIKLSQRNLNHNLKNLLGKIDKIPSGVYIYIESLKNNLLQQHYDNQELDLIPQELEFSETEEGRYFQKINFKLQRIEGIVQQAQRNRNRVSQLLILKDLKRSSFTKVSAIEYCKQKIKNFVLSNKNDIEAYNVSIVEKYDHNLSQCSIEKLSIEIVLDNLIENAFTAVLSLSRIKIEGDYNPTIFVSLKKEYKYIKITIEDNGIGISEKYKKEILNPYRYSAGSTEGIGLILVMETVSLEKGKISLYSKEGKGTKFEVQLPYKKRNIAP